MGNREDRTCWLVITNTDLTEGRGSSVILHHCSIEETALRLSHKRGVQGMDAFVKEAPMVKNSDGDWCAPVTFVLPTEEDSKMHERKYAFDQALKRARQLGLTDSEIEALRKGAADRT